LTGSRGRHAPDSVVAFSGMRKQCQVISQKIEGFQSVVNHKRLTPILDGRPKDVIFPDAATV